MTAQDVNRTTRQAIAHDNFACATFVGVFAAYLLRRLCELPPSGLNPAVVADGAFLILALTTSLGALLTLRAQHRHSIRAALIGASLGTMYFVGTLGTALADPLNVEWLMRGDWAQHFLGWYFFRTAPWAWPLGAFDSFWNPIGTSVVYTDSLPLVAIPLKLFAPLLPARFQYIGLWIGLNCVLQGAFGALLIKRFTTRVSLQAIGAAFFLITPVFIGRIYQDTLTTQWLILASLWLYFGDSDPRRALRAWLCLGLISALVHPYLCVMVVGILIAYYAERLLSHALAAKDVLTHASSVIATIALCWWISGAFIIKIRSGFEAGVYSANLLTWINPGFSRWLPSLPQFGDNQNEGAAYLGLGVLFLCAAAIVYMFIQRQTQVTHRRQLMPLIVAIGAMTLFAFSTRLTFGDVVIADFTPKHLPILGALRGCGRFIWPSVYAITLFAVVAVAQRAARIALPLVAFAFFVQLFELAPLQMSIALMRTGTFPTEAAPRLHDVRWTDWVRSKRHIVLFPPAGCGDEAAPYFPFSLLAADNTMSINTGYLARYDGIARARYCDNLQRVIDAGVRDRETLYIVRPDLVAHFESTGSLAMDCRTADTYTVCTAAPSSTP